jgi:tRNA (guanine26-N2/guanine27-N2)-dimethyltransferase
LATTAARYGRHIEPLLSLSIDFYVRLFIRVATSPKEVKALPSKTSLLYYCVDCQTPHFQPLGRTSERQSTKTGVSNTLYHAPAAIPIGDRCSQCNGKYHVSVTGACCSSEHRKFAVRTDHVGLLRSQIGGPMWSGPLHNQEFVNQMLTHIEDSASEFKTAERIKGMVTVAKNVRPQTGSHGRTNLVYPGLC